MAVLLQARTVWTLGAVRLLGWPIRPHRIDDGHVMGVRTVARTHLVFVTGARTPGAAH